MPIVLLKEAGLEEHEVKQHRQKYMLLMPTCLYAMHQSSLCTPCMARHAQAVQVYPYKSRLQDDFLASTYGQYSDKDA